MRIVLALVLMLTGMPALAQDLTVRLITPLEPMPGGMVELYGPLGSPVTASHGILPTLESYPINFRSGPLAEIRATTGAGAMQITIPDQALPLVMQSWGQLICPGGRPCLLLPTDPLGESFQLNSFSIALNAPVPDPEGSCLIVSGTVTSPVTAERPPGYAGTLTLQPLIPPPGEPLVPGTPVPAPVAETYQRPVTQTAHFMPPGSVDLEICGDVPDARVGRLAYTVREAGNGWSWTPQANGSSPSRTMAITAPVTPRRRAMSAARTGMMAISSRLCRAVSAPSPWTSHRSGTVWRKASTSRIRPTIRRRAPKPMRSVSRRTATSPPRRSSSFPNPLVFLTQRARTIRSK